MRYQWSLDTPCRIEIISKYLSHFLTEKKRVVIDSRSRLMRICEIVRAYFEYLLNISLC